MFCSKCGTLINDTLDECEKCGAKLNTRAAITYDYLTFFIDKKAVYPTIDSYQALGWEVIDQRSEFTPDFTPTYTPEKITINFRRNRKIKHKEQLNRLQAKLDDSFNSIKVLEKNKTQTALVVALILGVIGTLIFGAGMSLCIAWESTALWMYITGGILAAIGIVPCVLAYFVYERIKAKKTAEMNIQIEQKRDEIANLCEDAQKYLYQTV